MSILYTLGEKNNNKTYRIVEKYETELGNCFYVFKEKGQKLKH